MTPEELARLSHQYAQELGPIIFGEVWERMSYDWDDIPEKHKRHIIAVHAKMLDHFRTIAISPLQGEYFAKCLDFL